MSVDVDVALPEVSPAVFAGGGYCAGVHACHYWGGVLGRFCWGGGSLLMRLLWPM